MARYIDAERLKETFQSDTQHIRDWDVDLFDLLMLNIDEAPTADVAEVKHGTWRKTDHGIRISLNTEKSMRVYNCDCSCCGWYTENPWFNYCPNCGAKMDGKLKRDENI